MKKLATWIMSASALAIAGTASASEAIDELKHAAAALAESPSYTWTTTVKVAEGGREQGPTEGKIEKGGYMMVTTTGFQGNKQYVVKMGEKVALTTMDGGWTTVEEMEADTEGFGRFRATRARNTMAPAEELAETLKNAKTVTKEGDHYSAEFNEEGAQAMMAFGGRRRGGGGGQGGPSISGAKATAKFWITDGVLAKQEVSVEGTMDFNGNERNLSRTMTTVISEIGTTKVEVPEGAKAKLK